MSERLDAYRLSGKTATVTGVASGFGGATAELFMDVGAKVIIADLNGPAAESIAQATGQGASEPVSDVSDTISFDAMFAQALLVRCHRASATLRTLR
jgi:3-oxoacyl-[acyl-carrier protein] reductase